MEQRGEARVVAQVVEVRIDADEGEADGVLALGLGEKFERPVALVEERADDGQLVGRDALLGAVGEQAAQDFAGLLAPARGGEDVRALGAGGRRVAGEDALLLEGGERLLGEAAVLVRPAQDDVGGDGAGVEFQRAAALLDGLAEAAREEEDVGGGRGDDGRAGRKALAPARSGEPRRGGPWRRA